MPINFQRLKAGDKVNFQPPKSKKQSSNLLNLDEYELIQDPNEDNQLQEKVDQQKRDSLKEQEKVEQNHKIQNNQQPKNINDQMDEILSPLICQNFQLWGKLNVLEDYQNQLSSSDFIEALRMKKFDFRTNPLHKSFNNLTQLSLFNVGPNILTQEGRCASWQLFLGVDKESEEYKALVDLFHSLVGVKPDSKSTQEGIENLLMKDVCRTFSSLKLFNQDPKTGKNKLFNVLKVYSIYDIDIGYTQGMSFICAMILINVNFDEELAWVIFMKVMQVDEWRRLYTYQTPKLFELTKEVRDFIISDMPQFNSKIVQHSIILESLFASPFFTLFSNLIPMDQAVKILDRFILNGETVIIEIMKTLLKSNNEALLNKDCWELQEFLGRKMYESAIVEGVFLPLLENGN